MFGKKKDAGPVDPLAWHFRAISLLAVVVLGVDAYYSGRFGSTIDFASMIALAAISVGSGLLLVAVIYFYKLGHEGFSKGLTSVWAICFIFNVLSNMGVATSNRVVEVEKSNLKQAIHQERGKAQGEAKARLVLFQKQLTQLLEDDSWAGAVTATGLREQVAALRVSRESESRIGGCGQKCRGIENQISDIQGKIAIAEQRQSLEKRIDATKAVLAKARNTLADTDAGVSNTAAQASLYSRWTVGWSGDGESAIAVRNANELMGIGMALVIAVASVGFSLAGVWTYLMTITPQTILPQTGARSFPLPDNFTAQSAASAPIPLQTARETVGLRMTTVGELAKNRLRARLLGSDLQVAA